MDKVQAKFYLPQDVSDALRLEAARQRVSMSEIVERALRRELGMSVLTWQVIEDNGGGLHLVVFDGGDVIFYGYEYEFDHLALRENLQALQRGEDPREDGWDMPEDVDAPQRWYNELRVGETNGGVVIADNERIYYDRLGAEGTRFFIPRWDELELFDSDGNTLTTPENIREALQEFRRDGGMLGVFFHFLGFPHEDPEDASTWGPESPERVNWDGFDG